MVTTRLASKSGVDDEREGEDHNTGIRAPDSDATPIAEPVIGDEPINIPPTIPPTYHPKNQQPSSSPNFRPPAPFPGPSRPPPHFPNPLFQTPNPSHFQAVDRKSLWDLETKFDKKLDDFEARISALFASQMTTFQSGLATVVQNQVTAVLHSQDFRSKELGPGYNPHPDRNFHSPNSYHEEEDNREFVKSTEHFTHHHTHRPPWRDDNPFPFPRHPKIDIPNFSGNGTDDVLDWLYQIEHHFDIQRVADHDKVTFCKFYLKEAALQWWRWYKGCRQTVSWQEFRL